MTRIATTLAAALLLSLTSLAHADDAPPASAAAPAVVDLTSGATAAKGIVPPKLVDWTYEYPQASVRLNEEGTVDVAFIVRIDGSVSDVQIVQATRFANLNTAAVQAVMLRRYEPATRNGVPVVARIVSGQRYFGDASAPVDAALPVTPLDLDTDLDLSCRFGTQNIAIAACSALLRSGKGEREAFHYLRGNALMALGSYTLAMADFDEAIRLKPDVAAFYHHRGLIREATGNDATALADYDKTIALQPHLVAAYLDRAFIYARQNDKARMAQASKDALTNWPHCPIIPTGQAAFEGHLDRCPPLALPGWTPPLTFGGPPTEEGYRYRCWVSVMQHYESHHFIDRGPAAASNCDKALELKPGYPAGLETRGVLHLRNGEYDAAIVDFDAALAANPARVWSRYLRGLAKLKKGDVVSAKADILAARLAEPTVAATFAFYRLLP